jgi:hypothetical protein
MTSNGRSCQFLPGATDEPENPPQTNTDQHRTVFVSAGVWL